MLGVLEWKQLWSGGYWGMSARALRSLWVAVVLCGWIMGCASNPQFETQDPKRTTPTVVADDADDDPGMMQSDDDVDMTPDPTADAGDAFLVTPPIDCDNDPSTPGVDCAGVIACGGTIAEPSHCPMETHTCCASGPTEVGIACVEGGCDEGHIPATCDGPADCMGGEVCCIDPSNGFAISCVDECGGFTVCNVDEDCPAGQACEMLGPFPFWGSCS